MDKPYSGSDDSLISMLLEETYRTLSEKSGEFDFHQLDQHFDKQSVSKGVELEPTLENFLARQTLSKQHLVYMPQIGCYRLAIAQTFIDFPGNWGVFNSFVKELSFATLEEEELIKILSPYFSNSNNFALIGNFAELTLYAFNRDDEVAIQWLKKYFSKQDKKEAA